MKKLTMAIVVIALVLCMAQAVMAKVDITLGVKAGYEHYMSSYDSSYGKLLFWVNLFGLKINGQFDFTNKLGVLAQIGIGLGTHRYEPLTIEAVLNLEASIFAKYSIFANNVITIAVQGGLKGAYYTYDNLDHDEIKILFITPGIYVNANINLKLRIYTDIKIPVFYVGHSTWAEFEEDQGFFKYFLYDVALGVSYDISPAFSIGIEATSDNTIPEIVSGMVQSKAGDFKFAYGGFTVGMKVNCKF